MRGVLIVVVTCIESRNVTWVISGKSGDACNAGGQMIMETTIENDPDIAELIRELDALIIMYHQLVVEGKIEDLRLDELT